MENHFYPFFWQHGESEDTLINYIDKINKSGMKGLCIESRPHPDFVGEQWWHDMEIIIRECQKREMQVWILDDSHFPTGFANGKIKENHSEYLKQYLTYRRFDVTGPFKGARIDASQLKGRPWEIGQVEMIDLLGVFLVKRAIHTNQLGDPIDMSTLIDITEQFKEDTIYLDIPKGDWSVFVVFSTHDGGEESTKDYLNPLVSEATQVLIDEVYDSHYKHFGNVFGSTITAFFSDEPRFGNIKGTQAKIGSEQVLPWRPGLEKDLEFSAEQLLLLWVNDSYHLEKEVRYSYMNTITKLYNKNFTKVLADWCQNHGVNYVGHNIEDNGAHSRLGYGTGHFFCGQEGQHYSGIDVIGGQIVPGMPYHHDAYQTGGSDGQFYHYGLAKLGASAAHLYPHKQGRAMCEAFGAYGWNEGLKTMKWITDHLMVRGINTIVPHAFSPKAFPDFDCPPHFYAHGHNPQYRYLTNLTNYANRVMERLSGGRHLAPVAVLYPAELEWVGESMPVEVVTQQLTECQMDMDIVPLDLLIQADVIDGRLHINQETFEVLIIPEATYYPKKVIDVLNNLVNQGLPIIIVNQTPNNQTDLDSGYQVVQLSDLATYLASVADITLSEEFPRLVYYHYQKEEIHYYLFFNESLSKTVETTVSFKDNLGQAYSYDAYHDTFTKVKKNYLILKPYETCLWIFGKTPEAVMKDIEITHQSKLSTDWKVSFADSLSYPNFHEVTNLQTLMPLNLIEGYEQAVGTVAYETILNISDDSRIIGFNLGEAYEIAEVFVNGQSLGQQIAPPYIFLDSDCLKQGDNILRIEVTNTLGTQFRGGLNQYLLIEPFGIMEDISLLYGDMVSFDGK